MFRRRRQQDDEAPDADDFADVDDTLTDDPAATSTTEGGRPRGPWDSTDAPDDDRPRVDLGSLLIPVVDGMEVRVDVQEQTVVAATIVDGNSAMQIHAFAAPRSAGIWSDVRREIADSIRESGGTTEEADGDLGVELRARVTADVPGQGRSVQAMRFIGVDGPRWFLRGLLTGAAATDIVRGRQLIDVFRHTVVVRGGEAMAPREMLPLRLPKEAMQHAPEPAARPGLDMLERGPEITETR